MNKLQIVEITIKNGEVIIDAAEGQGVILNIDLNYVIRNEGNGKVIVNCPGKIIESIEEIVDPITKNITYISK